MSAAVRPAIEIRAPEVDAGGAARLPYLVRAMNGAAVVDTVPAAAVASAQKRGMVIEGRGERLSARATWTPANGDVPRWDVDVEVANESAEALQVGFVVALELDATAAPGWLVPGLFYGENRPAASRGRYPRWVPAGTTPPDDDEFAAAAWTFRADRAAIPAIFARDRRVAVTLATNGWWDGMPAGIGFAASEESTEVSLAFPYREEPLVYDGSDEPLAADIPTVRLDPGERRTFAFRVYVTDVEAATRSSVLRDLHAWLSAGAPLAPWLDAAAAAGLAAEGLLRWHFRPADRVLIETAAFQRPAGPASAAPGDRMAMHVAWLSGAPSAAALLAHGRRTRSADAERAGRDVLDAIAANLAPCGTFWAQWSAASGWGKGWTPGEDAVHARTLAEATLFFTRAAVVEGPRSAASWRDAIASNLAFVAAVQRDDGAIPSAWNGRTGEPQSWAGTAGLAWVPALVEGGRLLGEPRFVDAAERAGEHYAPAVKDGRLGGAPEDVDLGPTSEDGYVALMAYVALLEARAASPHTDGESRHAAASEDRWLRLARVAADWMLTFRFAWNVPFGPATTLGQLGYASRGADQASPANQHLHAYGLVCLPELIRLARRTGDEHYLLRAREAFAAARQLIARRDGEFGARRGMMPERLHQTRFGGPRGEVGPLSHAWCLGLLLFACEEALAMPELADD